MIMYMYNGKYINKSDYIFTRRIIDDEIFLSKCISLEQELKDALFDDGSINDGLHFVNFLQRHYTNDEIIGIWDSIERNGAGLTKSGMKFFRSLNNIFIFYSFSKVENNFLDLFTAFVELRNSEAEWLKTHPLDLSYYAINNADYIPTKPI